MAGMLPLVLVIALSMVLSKSATATDVGVTISVANSPVISGGILAIQCEISNFQKDDFTVDLFRVINSRTEPLTSGKDIKSSVIESNLFLSSRSFLDGSVVYFFTILDVSSSDEGQYLCKVFDISRFTYITDDSIDIKINSYPSMSYPLCTTIPSQPVAVNVGDILKLKCTTETRTPSIQAKWINTKTRQYVKTRNTTVGNVVYSESSVLVDSSLQNVVFACEVISNVFSDWKRSCTVGPTSVRSLVANAGHVLLPNSKSKNHDTQNQQLGHCVKCTTDDMLQFHLTVATVATAFLAIVFLIFTLLLCYKYHHETPVIRRSPKDLASQQSMEPVYVSLQRRSVNADREYMTLEDPNNPDNKIIVPRETFDEYCKTMTMKGI